MAMSTLRLLRPSPAVATSRHVMRYACRSLARPASIRLFTAAASETGATPTTVRTFDNQNKMPRLPIPSLDNMASKFIASCKPLLSDAELAETEAAVAEFVADGGVGQTLQARLVEFDQAQPNSWLEDMWLNKAYLEYRDPTLINVNWWCAFIRHPNHPDTLIKKQPPKGVFTSFQIYRAAGLITNFLNFKDMLDRQEIAPDYIKETPLCMNQYRNIFGTTRVPALPGDKLRTVYPATARHIIVMARDHVYKVDVYREDGGRLPIKEIERLLFEVTGNCQEVKEEAPIGILTAGHRDNWAKAYTTLNDISNQNRENFNVIETALFAVCLDDHANHHSANASHLQFFHNGDAGNRWFDKAVSVIVSSSGQAGVNGEHSPVDAVVPGKVFEYVLSHEPAVDPEGAVASPPMASPIRLQWVVNETVRGQMEEAGKTAQELIRETDSCLLQTDVYGSRYIKEVAKCPPDAYVQMALQLAYYRMYGVPTAVYESASTRGFLHGRTETGRSMSAESLSFIRSFDDDHVLYDEKRARFAKAIAAQSGTMREAGAGRGIDRHMLGLRMMIRDEAEREAASRVFGSVAASRSTTFRLSTSNMSPGTLFWGGFGPVVADGFGVNYAIGKYELKFSISSRRGAGSDTYGTSQPDGGRAFRKALERTLQDMFILFPKRSEVWGGGWESRQKHERKMEAIATRMQALSDKRMSAQAVLAAKYAPKARSE